MKRPIALAAFRVLTALPGGIAPEILAGRFDHTQPHPLDNGLRYKPLNIDPEAPGGD